MRIALEKKIKDTSLEDLSAKAAVVIF